MHNPQYRKIVHPGYSRRGSVYLYALMLSLVLTTIGLALLSIQRVNARAASLETSITRAEGLARAAVDLAIETVVSDGSWRSRYTNDTWQPTVSLGGGQVSFKLVDETDSNLNNGDDPVRVYGRGTAGDAVRIYSVELDPALTALDVLRTASHAGGAASVSGTVTAADGPFSSNSTFTVGLGARVNGSIEALLVVSLGNVTGSGSILSAKSMPSSDIFTSLLPSATAISYASINSGTIDRQLLSPAANPWGAPNTRGLYSITVPSGSTLTIRRSRLVATLLIDLGVNASLVTADEWLAEPASADMPTLLVRTASGASVTLGGSTGTLDENSSNVNFNPAGTPYPYIGGGSDSDTADTYPQLLTGVAHVMGSGSTKLNANLRTKGVVISEGGMALSGSIMLQADPALLADPPRGYAVAGALSPVVGSWVWEKNE
ncbi:MAG: hypothetical protein IPJ41_03445 [Phycisphaerales bacterium]|nr:hypothetical protein [Phycisphaerales bacterium]